MNLKCITEVAGAEQAQGETRNLPSEADVAMIGYPSLLRTISIPLHTSFNRFAAILYYGTR